jgi:hypothetical protein
MSERSRVRPATDEDLERDFGPGRLLIGIPVRPPADGSPPPTAELPEEEEQP